MTHHKLMVMALQLKKEQRLWVSDAVLREIAKAMTKPSWKRSMFSESDLRDFICDCEDEWDVVFEDSISGTGYDICCC